MNLARTNAWLFALLCALAIGHWIGRSPTMEARGGGARPFAQLDPMGVQTVEVRGNEGESVRLERDGEGRWRVGGPRGVPAAAHPLEALLAALVRLASDERWELGGQDPMGFGSGVRATLFDSQGRELADVQQVLAPSTQGRPGAGTLARVGPRGDVFRTPLVPLLGTRPQHWYALGWSELSGRDPQTARALSARRGGEPVVSAQRDGPPGSRWLATVPKERESPRLLTERLLAILAQMRGQDVLAPPSAEESTAGPPDWEIELEFDDGQRLNWRFWERPQKGALVRSDAWPEPWVVELPRGSLEPAAQALEQLRNAPG